MQCLPQNGARDWLVMLPAERIVVNGCMRAVPPDIFFLKHASSIFRQSSNPVYGFSMMEQEQMGSVWPMENWLGSSIKHIQGWMTVWICYCHPLEQGYLSSTVVGGSMAELKGRNGRFYNLEIGDKKEWSLPFWWGWFIIRITRIWLIMYWLTGRRLNGVLRLSLNDRTILFIVVLFDKTVSVG